MMRMTYRRATRSIGGSVSGLISPRCVLRDRSFSRRARDSARLLQGVTESARARAELRRGEIILRRRKASKTNAASGADVVTRPFRRPFGARECNHARRSGATSMSPTCTVTSSAGNAKRPTEAGKLTGTALLENNSKSSARRASGPETLPEMRRGRLWGGSCRRGRADDMRAMEHETMETPARAIRRVRTRRPRSGSKRGAK